MVLPVCARSGAGEGQHAIDWHDLPQTAEGVESARVTTLIDHADDQRQRRCSDHG
jgi:hypothetical protein